jgi:exopolysaccharide biosynthesis polyprenyl glycosylphosphotransferase
MSNDPISSDALQVGRRPRSAVLHRLLAAADTVAALAAGVLAAVASATALDDALAIGAACALVFPVLTFICGLYAADDLRAWATGVPDLKRLLFAVVALSWPLFGMAELVDARNPARFTLLGALLTFACATLGRAVARALVHRCARLRERTAIVGSGLVAGELVQNLRRHPELGLVAVGIVENAEDHRSVDDLPHLGSLAQLPAILRAAEIDRVIIAFSRAGHVELLRTVRACRDGRVPVHIVPRLFEFLDGARSLDHVGTMPLLSLGVPRLSAVSRAAKRALDIGASTTGLVIGAPLFAIIAVAIKLDSPGRVLFRQPRVGRDAGSFELIKFRSMSDGADAHKAELAHANEMAGGVLFKIRRDPRVTRVGRLLRRFSLDELPQLWNVLRGDMSLVGPRPLVIAETERLAEDWHLRRGELRPGITGPWQIYGRSDVPFDSMVRFDYQYVAGWSLARDLEILCATVPAVLSGRGAY